MTTAEAATEMLDSPAAERRSWSLRRLLAIVAVVLALLSAFLTFVVLTGLTPIVPTHEIVVGFLAINSATILLLLTIIGVEVWQVIQARRRGRAASRLHVQTVALFSVIAVLPAVLVAAVAYITLDRGLDRLFNTRTKAVIENSVVVAHAYLDENARQIFGDMIAIAGDLARARPLYDQDRDSYRRYFQSGAQARNLPVAMLLDKDLKVLESASISLNQAFATPDPEFLNNVTEDKPEIAVYDNVVGHPYVAAVIRLRAYEDTFLYVARLLDPRVVSRLQMTRQGAAEFAELESRRLGIQIAFALMFTVIALTLLMSSVLIGLNFANWLVAPIRRLMAAANLVSTGDLKVQVPVNKSEGDLANLGETFNKMTSELRTQRDDLVRASDLIDSRRRFIEAVLSSASAGIIGVDEESKIAVLNRSAEKLIGHPESEALSRPLSEIVPELNEMMASAREGMQRLVQGQITISRGGKDRNLSVRVSAEQSGHTQDSYIITLDDITELVSAQRTSAWADVARRIAHEIKNPLTPIQLSAERIRRKYGKVIVEDRTVFDQCTDTIVRQVDDIRRMVDEFSRFARMPKPVIENEDVADTVRQVVFLMRVGHPDIDIDSEIKEDPMPARFDRRLISQGLQNIIKNASEAIAAVPPAELGKGRIEVRAARDGDDIVIDVIDNGIGLPKESRSRLLEPYVTTREKGTGLGLAIVGRILEDHGGRIELNDAAQIIPGQRGAWMRLRFSAAVPAAVEARVASPEAAAAAK
jgi:two-component system, NtrC family, nitrogen regulation sensor histidine kinase NtrY